MNTEATKIIEALGDTAEVSRLFDVRMPSVSDWKKAGIPKARMMYLQAVCPHALDGVDVTAATAKHARRRIATPPKPKPVGAEVQLHPHISDGDQHVSSADPDLKWGCSND